MKSKDRKDEYDEVSDTDNKIIVATYGVAAVGINISCIFNPVSLSPVSPLSCYSSIGVVFLKHKIKTHVQIWDITSSAKFSKRHLTERKKFYREAKYPSY